MTQNFTIALRPLIGIDFKVLEILQKLMFVRLAKNPQATDLVAPSQAWLARTLGVSLSTITRSIKRLCLQGFLLRIPRWATRDGRYLTNLYRIAHRHEYNATRFFNLFRWRDQHRKKNTKPEAAPSSETHLSKMTDKHIRYGNSSSANPNSAALERAERHEKPEKPEKAAGKPAGLQRLTEFLQRLRGK